MDVRKILFGVLCGMIGWTVAYLQFEDYNVRNTAYADGYWRGYVVSYKTHFEDMTEFVKK